MYKTVLVYSYSNTLKAAAAAVAVVAAPTNKHTYIHTTKALTVYTNYT